jgi:hypothetical protein
VPLAKPRIPTGEGSAEPIGDGIEREEGVEPRGFLEEATLPSIPLRAPRSRELAEQGLAGARALGDRVSVALAAFARRVQQRAPVWNADAEEKFAPLRPRLGKVHPRLATVPLWQLAVSVFTGVVCLVLVVSAF